MCINISLLSESLCVNSLSFFLKFQYLRVEREVGEGIGIGNTCISMADSCQCMTKTTTML